SKEKELVSIIEQMIRDKFSQSTLIPEVTKKRIPKEKVEQKSFYFDQTTEIQKELVKPYVSTSREMLQENEVAHGVINEDIVKEPETSIDKTVEVEQEITEPEITVDEIVDKGNRVPKLYPIGQLQGTYILAQNELGFYMVDQHAAQERIKYEFYKSKLGKPSSDLQQLLFPLTFEFTTDEMILIEKNYDEFQKIGLFLEPF